LLQRADIPSTLLLRRGSTRASQTLRIREDTLEQELAVSSRGLETLPTASIEGLFITTKANQAVEAFLELRPLLATGAPVVLLTNGMGLYEQLAALYPPAQLFIGTTTEAAWRDADGVIVHAGHGQTLVGQPGLATGPSWCQELAQRLDRFSWEPEIERSLWRKLLINCAINPLTAIHNCRNGELLTNKAWLAQALAVCDEFAAVANGRGMPDIGAQAREIALAVMASTAANQSSMLQDIQQGRETEIDYITGWLCTEAQRLQLPCPHNQALLEQVHSLSRSTRDNIAP